MVCNFRKNYKGYLLESRLHFRIHATRLSLSQLLEEDPVSDTLSKEEESNQADDNLVNDITSSLDGDGDGAHVSKSNGATAMSWPELLT